MRLLIATIFLLVWSSCFDAKRSYPPISSPSAAKVIANNCIDCHRDYENYTDKDFVFHEIITPKKPESSLLFATLKGADLGTHESMPPQRELSQGERDSVRQWIKELKIEDNIYKIDAGFIKNKSKRKLTDIGLLKRCYGQLVRQPLVADHPLVERVRSSKLNGAQACVELLKGMSLNSKGVVKKGEGRSILKTFQALHRSWFSELNFYNSDEQWGTFELFDPSILASYYTYSLLSEQTAYSDIFTKNISYRPVRKKKKKRSLFIFPFQDVGGPLKVADYKFGSGPELSEDYYSSWDVPVVPSGELIGVAPIPSNKYVLPKVVDVRKEAKRDTKQTVFSVNRDIFKSFGGGILGNPIYLVLNMKMEIGEKSDGGKYVPRKWGATIFRDFLCRDLPVAPLTTAKKYVAKISNHTFRKKASCVQCHMSMDGASGVVRNLEINYSVDGGLGGYLQTMHIRENKTTKKKSSTLLGEGLKDYHKEATKGRFVYKATNGILYDREINSLDDLGKSFVEVPDLYNCVVSRYLEFFTGASVDLNYRGEMNNYEKYLLSFTHGLARNLQVHQDLNKTIIEIIESPIYRDKFYLQPKINDNVVAN